MPSLRNVFFSRGSSSSSSPSDSPLSSERSLESRRRLTRQRKLRHVTEFDLGLRPVNDGSKSLPVSPNSGSRSPPNLKHWSISAVPQPLPLPELPSPSVVKGSDNFSSPGSGRGGVGGGSSSSSVTGRKTTNDGASKPSKLPTYHRRGFHQDTTGTTHSFRLNVPARSAPSSGFSSPAVSPQRFRSVDVLRSSQSIPHEFQAPSTSEVLNYDGLADFPSHVLPERVIPSPDNSPLHSPALLSPRNNIGNPNSVAWNSPLKSPPENSVSRSEGNSTNVHPLPLPPGSSLPSNSSHSSHTKDGSFMKGQWQKDKLIGRGTYGSVYIGISSKDGAMCAIKEVDVIACDSKSAECIKQLEQEIKVLQQLEHPNIVRYYGSEIVEDRFCIYLEYVHPGSLNNYVREHFGSVTESVVRNFTRHILSGLAYLHSKKTIHRDIKGANLLVNASGIVKLADFGLAKHLTGYAADLSLKGSPHWMAPEVLQSMLRKDANPELAFAIDIWSVGCTVIEMLTGKPPWSEFNGVQAMFQVLHRSPAVPETLSAEGKDFLMLCFQRNPADRPTAVKLLDHPFLKKINGQNVSSCRQEFCGIKLNDKSASPRDWSKHKDLKSLPPNTRIKQCRPPINGEARRHSYAGSLDAGPSEVHPCTSPSDIYYNLHIMNSSSSNCWQPRAGNYHPRLVFKTEGREVPYL